MASNRSKQQWPLQGHCVHGGSGNSHDPPVPSDETSHYLRLVNPPGSSGNWMLGTTINIDGRTCHHGKGKRFPSGRAAQLLPINLGSAASRPRARSPHSKRAGLWPGSFSSLLDKQKATEAGFPSGGMKAHGICPFTSRAWETYPRREGKGKSHIQGKLHTLPEPPVLKKGE